MVRLAALTLLCSQLALAQVGTPHPWAKFKPGAWIQFISGETKFTRDTITLVRASPTTYTVKYGLNGASPELELGLVNASSAPGKKVLRRETLSLAGQAWDCQVVQASSTDWRQTDWVAAGVPFPVKRITERLNCKERYPGSCDTLEWTLAERDVPMFVGRHALKAYRFEGGGKTVPRQRKWLSTDVPGGEVVVEELDAQGLASYVRVVEAFGLSGAPVGADIAAQAWHPWASHPVGAWSQVRVMMNGKAEESRATLARVAAGTYSLGGADQARGWEAAAADPTSAFKQVAEVTVAGVGYPCIMYGWVGKDQDGLAMGRDDCVSPFARVPLYSVSTGSVAGVSYRDSVTATSLEKPLRVGKQQVMVVEATLRQKISNGATSTRHQVLSADVPGGLVRSESQLGADKPFVLDREVLDFGHR
jgi:hypothetical protein